MKKIRKNRIEEVDVTHKETYVMLSREIGLKRAANVLTEDPSDS